MKKNRKSASNKHRPSNQPNKAKKVFDESKSCPYASILSKMPPLAKKPKWARAYVFSNSEPLRFIILAIQRKSDDRKSWSLAQKLFLEATKKKIIIKDSATGLYKGRDYNAATVQPRIEIYAYEAKNWGLIAYRAKHRHSGGKGGKKK